MSIKKIIIVGTAILINSYVARAGTMGECLSQDVTVPCEWNQLEVGAHALYMQPTYNPNYLYPWSAADYVGASQDWKWGFQIEGKYRYKSGSDLAMDWYHVNGAQDTTEPGYGTGRFRSQWNAVNLEMAQTIDLGNQKNMRFHAGFSYAQVKTGVPEDVNYAPYYYTTTFNGVGPRLGVNMHYGMGYGFSVYGKTAGAVLVGNATNSAGHDVEQIYNGYGSASAIVPELDAKLGLEFSTNWAGNTLTADIGWMWIDYFSVAQVNPGINNNQIDFGLQGLYFGLKWAADV